MNEIEIVESDGLAIATVSRIRRADDGELGGYQRPEVLSHIAEIRNYLESDAPMVPNAVVIAFDSRVTFVAEENNPPGRTPDLPLCASESPSPGPHSTDTL